MSEDPVRLTNKLYFEAKEAKEIIKILISSKKFNEFEHLTYAKIKCLFKDKLEGRGWNKLGKVEKVNDLYWSLLDLDFVIVVNKLIWDHIEREERIAFIAHLLSKIKVYYKLDGKKKKTLRKPKEEETASFDVTLAGRINYVIVPPDVEEFELVQKKFKDSYEKLKEVSMVAEENE